ncbi:polymorphic toxin-type HINT domain-containing protein [Actinomadura yumaensis]|uniref:polymorphic toxin-type HINT domain-containing protein n=1 Tax=Actinomadura yumaensis TaxID=111807 RepID=UPI0036088781
MADGSHKPIENVNVGDQVLATDPETGTTQAKPVLATITSKGDKNLVQISVDTDAPRPHWTTGKEPKNSGTLIRTHKTANSGVIIATDAHPFWVAGNLNTWVKATDLKPGMWLRTSAGTYVQVTETKHWSTRHQRVHNLTIADEHTYYVLAGPPQSWFTTADLRLEQQRGRRPRTQQ